MNNERPPGKEELAPVPEEERFRRLEELQEEQEEKPGSAAPATPVSEPED